jgi:hypothetical protein
MDALVDKRSAYRQRFAGVFVELYHDLCTLISHRSSPDAVPKSHATEWRTETGRVA